MKLSLPLLSGTQSTQQSISIICIMLTKANQLRYIDEIRSFGIDERAKAQKVENGEQPVP